MRNDDRKLSVAILGTRGVPPRYGGFETFAGELGRRLVARGHRVTVYCRASLYQGEAREWNGVRRIELPAMRSKYLETVSHAGLSAFDALARDFDAVLVCNAANAFVLPLLAAARIPTAINVDGIERMRAKWNALGRFVYMTGEALSVMFADRVVADAQVIADYYREKHQTSAEIIAYGSGFPDEPDNDVLARLGLDARGYVLYVSRLEPENHPLEVARGYRDVGSPLPLVLLGDAPYSAELIAQLKSVAAADPRVRLTGGLYGADYRTLQRNALLYVQATGVGGTHPALIEAMGSGGAVVAFDTPENREVGGDAIRYFTFDDRAPFAEVVSECLAEPQRLDEWRTKGRERARRFDWDAVTEAYERLFGELAG
ncbi:MAG: glycosyltransferase [Thermoanaerobaculia bacterium]|jgi:glycosyltransferase involved in cell wall biosynthesis